MKRSDALIIFVLGVVTGLLSWNIITLLDSKDAYAGDASGGTAGVANGMIAVTGAIDNNTAGLWIIDTRETNTSPSLALYVPSSRGRSIALTAARRIKYDLQLVALNDRSTRVNRDLHPATLGRKIRKINEDEEKKAN